MSKKDFDDSKVFTPANPRIFDCKSFVATN